MRAPRFAGCIIAAALLFMTFATARAEKPAASPEEVGFDAFLAGLVAARAVVDASSEAGSAERAEGYRYIVRRIAHNLGGLGYDADPAHPLISRCPSGICKLGFDNPDNSYISVGPLSHRHTYRVYGTRGDVPLMLFQVFNRPPNWGGGANLDSQRLRVEPDGRWEIILGAKRPEGARNWLKLDDQSASLVVRNSFYDWNAEREPSIQVEVVGGAAEPVAHFTPRNMRIAGITVGRTIAGQVEQFTKTYRRLPLHSFIAPRPGGLGGGASSGGFPGNFTSRSNYELAEDEALVIESRRADVPYHNIQLGNVWLESLDYASRQTSLNASQARIDSDGVYRYVLAHVDPGVPNWLDVSGHPRGSIFMRWTLADPDDPPAKPRARVVKLDRLRAELPAETPEVSAEERRRLLNLRMSGFIRRANPAGL